VAGGQVVASELWKTDKFSTGSASASRRAGGRGTVGACLIFQGIRPDWLACFASKTRL
jgi:hypothetical protein